MGKPRKTTPAPPPTAAPPAPLVIDIREAVKRGLDPFVDPNENDTPPSESFEPDTLPGFEEARDEDDAPEPELLTPEEAAVVAAAAESSQKISVEDYAFSRHPWHNRRAFILQVEHFARHTHGSTRDKDFLFSIAAFFRQASGLPTYEEDRGLTPAPEGSK